MKKKPKRTAMSCSVITSVRADADANVVDADVDADADANDDDDGNNDTLCLQLILILILMKMMIRLSVEIGNQERLEKKETHSHFALTHHCICLYWCVLASPVLHKKQSQGSLQVPAQATKKGASWAPKIHRTLATSGEKPPHQTSIWILRCFSLYLFLLVLLILFSCLLPRFCQKNRMDETETKKKEKRI